MSVGGPGHANRMWALGTAFATLDRGMCVIGERGAYRQPMPAFLIEHDRGLLLLDTGLVPRAAVDAEHVYGSAILERLSLEFAPDGTVESHLATLGFAVSDVTQVVLSHAHWDHTGGLHLFSGATFYVGRDELRWAFRPDPPQRLFFRHPDLESVSAARWLTVEDDFDVFGDGSIQIITAPGHTPGNLALLVRLHSQTVLLTGDTVHMRSAWDGDLQMPADYSGKLAVQSISKLKRIARAHEARVWIGHDADDWTRFGGALTCHE